MTREAYGSRELEIPLFFLKTPSKHIKWRLLVDALATNACGNGPPTSVILDDSSILLSAKLELPPLSAET
jgi:hypothetical protein